MLFIIIAPIMKTTVKTTAPTSTAISKPSSEKTSTPKTARIPHPIKKAMMPKTISEIISSARDKSFLTAVSKKEMRI